MARTRTEGFKSAADRRRAPGLAEDFADLMRAIRNLVGHYHPEQHYMRGPGPAWHAKHELASGDAVGVPALVRVKA